MKIKKILVGMLVSISLSGAVAAPVAAVADEVSTDTEVVANQSGELTVNEPEFNDVIDKKEFSEEQVEQLVAELAKNYPELSVEYLREGVYKQLRGDYSIGSAVTMRAAWQGITVAQMGAFLDTAIGVALGGAVGGLVAVMKKAGKHAAKTAVKSAMIKYGLIGGLIGETVIDFVLNLASPGTYLAKYWDKRDKVPNNGRINF